MCHCARLKDTMTDLAKLKTKDSQQWRRVLQEHTPRLLGYATRMVGSRSQAEDVVQSALVGVISNIDNFDGRCSIKSWLFRAVRNRAIDVIRDQKRWVSPPDDDPSEDWFNEQGRWAPPPGAWDGSPDARLDAKHQLERVRSQIDTLPHHYREVILLKDVHQLENTEIAEVLELSAGNLRIRLHRARKALRAAVDAAIQGG